MAERKKILWLVSWYPNKYDRFDGDFIQRHARAAALYHDVQVIFIKQWEEQKFVERESTNHGNLSELIVYLPKQKSLLTKWKNYRDWKGTYQKEVHAIIKNFQPRLVHVQVPWKAGLVALWIKRKYKIPFLITEHWGIYNRTVGDNIYTKPFIVRNLLKKIIAAAKAVVSVSKFLGDGINQTLLKKEFVVIPNVVDTSLFFLSDKKQSRFTFIHVSNMVPLKNVEGIINAFHQFLGATKSDAQLILIGNRDSRYQPLAEQLGLLNQSVFFRGEIPYADVATEMQQAHVFVLNSVMENSPCVIGEALCCGLPVIATNVGGIPELIAGNDHILIEPNNLIALINAMTTIYKRYHPAASSCIAAEAKEKFSPSVIGAELSKLYVD